MQSILCVQSMSVLRISNLRSHGCVMPNRNTRYKEGDNSTDRIRCTKSKHYNLTVLSLSAVFDCFEVNIRCVRSLNQTEMKVLQQSNPRALSKALKLLPKVCCNQLHHQLYLVSGHLQNVCLGLRVRHK